MDNEMALAFKKKLKQGKMILRHDDSSCQFESNADDSDFIVMINVLQTRT